MKHSGKTATEHSHSQVHMYTHACMHAPTHPHPHACTRWSAATHLVLGLVVHDHAVVDKVEAVGLVVEGRVDLKAANREKTVMP